MTDRENTLWIATATNGIYHIGKNRTEHFTSAQGLSSDSADVMYRDHEGNMWVVTSRGIDEFRDLNVATWSTAEGIDTDFVTAIVAATNGTVYAGNNVLDLIRDDHVSAIGPAQGLTGQEVTSLLEDHAGRLWVGIDNGLAIYENNRFSLINRPDGSQLGVVISMTEDTDGNIWAETIGNPQRLARIRNREVVEELSLPQNPVTIAADRQEGIWLALGNGDLARYRGQQLQTFPAPSSPFKRQIQQLIVNDDGSVLGATSAGLVGLRNGKVQNLASRNGLPCDNLDGLVMDAKGSLWLHAECGLIEISKSELQNARPDPGAQSAAGVRSNFIVGFPGETATDLAELELFLGSARLDAIGIFGYSDEDGTEAASRSGKLDDAEIARRVEEFADLADELMAQRAADRMGETLDVLIEDDDETGPGIFTGRAAHQAPEVDGVTTVRSAVPLAPGDMVRVVVTGSDGVDLIADAIPSAALSRSADAI